MLHLKKLILLFGTLVGIVGCSTNADDPTVDSLPTPTISFISVTPTTAQQFTDSLAFKIEYVDGNGDIGDVNPAAENLFVIDSRIGLTHKLRIPQLSPTSVAIKGVLAFTLKNTILTNPDATTEIVRYKIYLQDRAGNKSNEIMTPEITVKR